MEQIFSMTGFGRAEGQYKHKRITIEIRTLNSKTLDLNLKMPSFYREKEFSIRNHLAEKLLRGKIELIMMVELKVDKSVAKINREVFDEYYRQLKDIYSGLGYAVEAEALASITRFPEVFEEPKDTLSDEEWEVVEAIISQATRECARFRSTEGDALKRDIMEKIDAIEILSNEVSKHDPTRQLLIRERLMAAFASLSQPEKFDPARFEQELIYYLERLDINEEKVRLIQHLNYFRQTINQGGAVGRKLGFITQEIGREINTMGSKASNFEIQQLVVQMKDQLEQIKEQLLNIL
ncbi:MAG TPA: YicC family protein [Salinivirgaceae bacterium]|nr:YicC family protein [Salinivirgaceae bacterium]